MADKVKVGLIGCGKICDAYFKGSKPFKIMQIVACADLIDERAKAKAQQYEIPRACSVQELLADPEIQIVINLTIPAAHTEVNLAAIEAGKHVHVEKPLALNMDEAKRVLAAAKKRNVRVGCAPDTFFGGGAQTVRKLIDEGAIGVPVAATAFWLAHGHESWHPAPEFYYKPGGGPMLDMGPYYLTALVNQLGPVKRVSGSARTSFATRTITSQPLNGTVIDVEVPTHYSATLDFASGAIGTVVTSFDVWSHHLPIIEIYGSEGSITVPHPNGFGGACQIRPLGSDKWEDIQVLHSTEVSRGVGVADMAYGIVYNRPHRASGELACHMLEIMLGVEQASRTGEYVELTTTCQRPAMLPPGLPADQLDE